MRAQRCTPEEVFRGHLPRFSLSVSLSFVGPQRETERERGGIERAEGGRRRRGRGRDLEHIVTQKLTNLNRETESERVRETERERDRDRETEG